MASLNLSINGPSIKSSYQAVVNSQLPSSSSPTYGQWVLLSVQAPLLNAFQDNAAKESILKVESKGEGELADLVEDFNEGRIQFAFVKVKDQNTGLPKNVLIAWCGGGVPERTKGYFTSHLAAVSKTLHGYHVQITARSDADLDPETIIRKVADASGAKYTAGGSTPSPSSAGSAPPAVAKKPVFTPTTSSSGSPFNPLLAARNRRQQDVDEDGWGPDAPQVTRTELEKVEPAYKPTKVNLSELVNQNQESSKFNGGSRADDRPSDVVKGGYQPVGKVDIAAIRAQAQKTGDDRPAPVKGAYEPVGKVDIAAIRAKSQRPAEPAAEDLPERPKSLAERSAAFTQAERLTELPKPKVAKKFGGTPFVGTKAPAPAGLGLSSPSLPPQPPVGIASRTFADEGGKTPAQIWAEKKARERGTSGNPVVSPPVTSPVTAQKSGGEWRSAYSGKSWAPVQTTNFGRGDLGAQKTGGTERSERSEPEAPASPAGGVAALKDRFKNAQPMGTVAPSAREAPVHAEEDQAPPPLPTSTRPVGGVAVPGLPSRPPAEEEEQEEEHPEPEHSPVRIAVPVPRGQEPEIEPPAERNLPPPVPTEHIQEELPSERELPQEEEAHNPRGAATAVAEDTFGHTAVAAGQVGAGGKRALIQYDYEKAEDNEIDLREGEYVTNIEMVDADWWMGTNSKGESGLFPSNYVELVDEDEEPAPGHAAEPTSAPAPEPVYEAEPHQSQTASAGGPTATALYDYEAAEDNELSFPEGAKITNLEFPDEDWWFGHYNGAAGLFPANYVQLDA
ncbi:hypothetical protein VTK73DRAFT_7627 [Phialemonium thermophilum]|uniref:Drebrin-like protein n=1 Tax=Phialemonium thermophilum TaxID=223376 RepID=A0ABR3Y6E6_9PEZI